MKKNHSLRSSEERKCPTRYGMTNVEHSKKSNTFMKPQKSDKKEADGYMKKLEKDLHDAKTELGALKEEADERKTVHANAIELLRVEIEGLKHQNAHLKVSVRDLKKENETDRETLKTRAYETIELLSDEIDGLKNKNAILTATVKDLKKENEILMSLSLSENLKISLEPPDSSTEQSFDLSVNENELHSEVSNLAKSSSNERSPLFVWVRIFENIQYDKADFKLKKHPEESKQFVQYIGQNVYEDVLEGFITESAKLIFKKNFFLKRVSFKHEKERTCVKGTKILNCLEEAIKAKFCQNELPGDLTDFIRQTFYLFKQKINRVPDLWVEKEE